MRDRSVRNKALPCLDWPFARQCARAQDLDDLRDLLQVEFHRLGFRYFCCCSHVRPDHPPKGAVFLLNYPLAWVERHMAQKYFRCDPVFIVGRNLTLPFRWDDPAFRALLDPEQIAILAEAETYGLKYGVTIPLNGRGRYSASCSLVSESDDIDTAKVHLATHYAQYAYEAARALVGPAEQRPRIILPRRERQCMELMGQGKDDEATAIILGIERETVRQYIDSAKVRLNTTKRPQAIAYAIYTEAINIEDLFGA